MNEDSKTSILIAVLVFFISIPIFIIWSGYVLSYLWLWFIVPLGVPSIAVGHAVGIMALKNFVFAKYTKEKTEKGKVSDLYAILAKWFTVPAFALLFGYIIKNWFV